MLHLDDAAGERAGHGEGRARHLDGAAGERRVRGAIRQPAERQAGGGAVKASHGG